MPIRILSPEIASQIAAGEVVERPASVVKELLENALDAGATNVSVTVEGAGKTLIEIADDGQGISATELPLAVERHATSKLTRADDLFHITTLGFRGEALASIGSVSQLTLTSALPGNPAGARIKIDAGHATPLETIGAPQGTVVRVEHLFFNVPARLKFLKADTTERRQIDALVTRYALAYPYVRFRLQQEGRLSLQTSGKGDRREVLGILYGPDIARQMLEVNAAYEHFRLTGFTSPTALTRSNRGEITFFVNGRWVQDPALTAALIQAYHTLLMVGRFPLAVLFLDLPPEMVDVNVHPTKAEVRFRDRDQVFADVARSVRRALLAHTPIPEVNTQLRWTSPQTSEIWSSGGYRPATPSQTIEPAWDMPREPEAEPDWNPDQPSAANTPPQPELPTDRVPLLRLVGQVATSYLIAEGPDGLYLIDQHAAHERVLFEKFMAQRGRDIPAQRLLEPTPVELPPHQTRLLEGQLLLLGKLGFQVEEFGRNTFLVRAIPVVLSGLDPRAALRVLVEDFEEDETPLQSEIEAKIIARVCKRAAVKAGQVLSPEEQRALIHELESCNSPRTCPHGRPTMIHLSVDLLERQFGRRGAR
ncbi:MAG: DNA mismatch repair endonuclease MutL [Anaerolineales bacterium]|nr:DNA mismatch repair endonuclease MutL [Anaerolineales bacterium]